MNIFVEYFDDFDNDFEDDFEDFENTSECLPMRYFEYIHEEGGKVYRLESTHKDENGTPIIYRDEFFEFMFNVLMETTDSEFCEPSEGCKHDKHPNPKK